MTSLSAAQTRSCSKKLFSAVCIFVIPVLVIELGCGSGAGMKTVNAIAPAISSEPTNQSAHIGGSASFTVVASGTAPLRYQWSKNGAAISGATSASYSTPAVAATDAGAGFSVTVTNAVGSTTSTPATLTVLPRAPAAGDWRFQGIDLPFSPLTLDTNLLLGSSWYTNSIGSPLEIGSVPGICAPGVAQDCSWFYAVAAAPAGVTGITSYYAADVLSNLDSDLIGLATPNIVITSLDIEPANQIFADSWLQTSGQDGFVLEQQLVDPTQIQAVASELGAEGRVITAVSFNAAQISVLSYLWQSDTTSTYDVSVVTATTASFWKQAQGLAQKGYIITAMGGHAGDGVVLVGTKVKGDAMARPFQYYTTSGTRGQVQSDTHSLLRLIFMPDGNDSFNEQ